MAIITLDREAILAGHPAYALTLAVIAAASVAALPLILRRGSGRRGKRWVAVAGRVVAALVVVGLSALLIWLRPFAASEPALSAMRSGDGVAVESGANAITFRPQVPPTVGIIFYPGARVDPRAYAAYMRSLAVEGYAAFIIKIPYNIAFLATERSAAIIADHPEIRTWVVGGHSLGGVVASLFAADHPDRVAGLLLYASYPASDLSAPLAGTAVTSISGSNDGLATPAKVAAAKPFLPATTRYLEIQGGTHAFFGDYGEQPGDGQPAIAREAARAQITAASLELLRQVAAQVAAPPLACIAASGDGERDRQFDFQACAPSSARCEAFA